MYLYNISGYLYGFILKICTALQVFLDPMSRFSVLQTRLFQLPSSSKSQTPIRFLKHISYTWWLRIWKGWVNHLSKENHVQHPKTPSPSMWNTSFFLNIQLRSSLQLAWKEALGWVVHGQKAGRDGGSYKLCCQSVLRWMSHILPPWVYDCCKWSIWTQYRSIVYSSMLSTFLLVLGVENASISEHQYENVPQQWT